MNTYKLIYKQLSFLFVLLIGVQTAFAQTVWNGTVDTDWYDPNDDYFLLSTAEELAGLAVLVNNGTDDFEYKTVALGENILLNNITDWNDWGDSETGLNMWTPIGKGDNSFKGIFDGGEHIVRGMYISGTNNTHQGLFGFSHGTIMDLGVEAFYVKGQNDIGGLAGRSDGKIANCYAIGKVSGSLRYIGGLVGYGDHSNCLISNSYALTNVLALPEVTHGIGGLFGGVRCKIVNSYAAGTVTATGSPKNIGGLIGDNTKTDTHNSYYDDTNSGDNSEGTPKTTLEMASSASYTGWDFKNIWEMDGLTNGGMPYLLWQDVSSVWDEIDVEPIGIIEYTGSQITPKPEVTFNGAKLEEDVNFEYKYGENINVLNGGFVHIVGIGSYEGKKHRAVFEIAPKNDSPAFPIPGPSPIRITDYKVLISSDIDSLLPQDYFWKDAESVKKIYGTQPIEIYYQPPNYGMPSIGTIYVTILDITWYTSHSSENAFVISTAQELAGLAELVNDGTEDFSGKTVMLGADIDLSGYKWIPIGIPSSEYFKGTFDGKGYKISGMSISVINDDYSGLFGYFSGAIKNLGLDGFSVNGTNYTGGLIGYAMDAVEISNVWVDGNVTGADNVGGFIGYANATVTIKDAMANGSVTGADNVGGFVGYAGDSIAINNAWTQGNVTGVNNVGGFIGNVTEFSYIVNARATETSSVTGNDTLGGFIGLGAKDWIKNSYMRGTIARTDENRNAFAGGFVGYTDARITIQGYKLNIYNSYSTVQFSSNWVNKQPIYGIKGNDNFENVYYIKEPEGEGSCNGYNCSSSAEMRSEAFAQKLNDYASMNISSAKRWVYNHVGYPELSKDDLPPFNLANYFASGDGTENKPYLIKTKRQLTDFASIVNAEKEDFDGKYVALGADINLNDTLGWEKWDSTTSSLNQWIPIGQEGYFKGTFDGRGNVINGMYISISNSNGEKLGLFGYIDNAEIKNLGVNAFYINGGASIIVGIRGGLGGIAGYANGAIIRNVWANGNITGDSDVGGLIGSEFEDSEIINSYSAVKLKGNSKYTGGLIGSSYNNSDEYYSCPNIKNAYFNGNKGIGDVSKKCDISGAVRLDLNDMRSEDFMYDLNDYIVFSKLDSAKKWVYDGSYPKLSADYMSFDIAYLFESGNGEEDTPYVIKTKRQLTNFAKLVNNGRELFENKYVALGDDITLEGKWIPIGTSSDKYFKGTFDGQGNTISGMKISGGNNLGLFGYFGGTLKNLGISDYEINGSQNLGAVVGRTEANATLINVWADGTISGTSNMGGLVGYVYANTAINNSYALGSITGTSSKGGLVGYSNFSASLNITNCYSAISSNSLIGTGSGTVSHSFLYDGTTATSNMKEEVFANDLNEYASLSNIMFAKEWEYNEAGFPKLTNKDVLGDSLQGDGSKEKPYIISKKEELILFAKIVNMGKKDFFDEYVALGGDIDFSDNIAFIPIGTYGHPFRGSFDGRKFSISNITIDTGEDNQGLFGSIDGARIENIYVSEFEINGGNYIGAIVGRSNGNSSISNSCAKDGKVTGGDYVGGLAGSIGSIASSCAERVSVNGNNNVGGLAGSVTSVNLSYVNSDLIKANINVGGLVGEGSYITNSYAIVNVEGYNYVGGLLGKFLGYYDECDVCPIAKITHSYASGEITSSGNYIGGLVGDDYVELINSYYNSDGNSSSSSSGGSSSSGVYMAPPNGPGLSGEEMQNESIFIHAGWDFTNIWDRVDGWNESMPFLRWAAETKPFPNNIIVYYTYKKDLTLADIPPYTDCNWASPTAPVFAGNNQIFPAIYQPQGFAPSYGTITVNISKKEGEPDFPPIDTIDAVFSEGLILGSIIIKSEGYEWQQPGLSVEAGNYNFSATYLDSNYTNSIAGKITVNISPAKSEPPSFPSDTVRTTYNENKTLASVWPPNNYTWVSEGAYIGNVGANVHKADYKNKNYEYSKRGDIIVIVEPKEGTEPTPAQNPDVTDYYKEGLTLGSINMDNYPGYKWVNEDYEVFPKTYELEATYVLNYTDPVLVTLNLTVNKNPTDKPAFYPISVDVSYSSDLTLAKIPLDSGYAWVDPTTKVPEGTGQQFLATYKHPHYTLLSEQGKITVNVHKGSGILSIENWTYKENPSVPDTSTQTNGAITLEYRGTTYSGTLYEDSEPPTEAGEYTLTATYAAMYPYPAFTKSVKFEVEKAPGEATVIIDGWRVGSTTSNPAVFSETNGTDYVSYIYRSIDNSYAPQKSKPYNSGDYMLIATFPATSNYATVKDTTYFTISNLDAIELTVLWSSEDVFEFNKMVQYPVPYVEHNGTEIPLTLLNARSEAGKYSGILSARAVIENEKIARNYVLKNNTKSFEITKKPLKTFFKEDGKIDGYGSNEKDTVWVPHYVFADSASLHNLLKSLLAYNGFATDTTKKPNETDNESTLNGDPKITLNYESLSTLNSQLSTLSKRVETTQKATATIITDDVSAKNYTLSRSSVVVMEAIEEEDGLPQIFCRRNLTCAPMSEASCAAIGGAVVSSCTMYCILEGADGEICVTMPMASCAIMEGKTTYDCGSTPLVKNFSFAGKFRIWQTASGTLNIDLGYMPPTPVTMQIYNLKGSLISTEQIKTRYASIKLHSPTGKYVFKAGKISATHVVY
ncbi:MAG: hypothetical protein FWC26_11030 [Fibromonadales bacterium]|nr:hypothetical protein [Fibromonadales bacterium]